MQPLPLLTCKTSPSSLKKTLDLLSSHSHSSFPLGPGKHRRWLSASVAPSLHVTRIIQYVGLCLVSQTRQNVFDIPLCCNILLCGISNYWASSGKSERNEELYPVGDLQLWNFSYMWKNFLPVWSSALWVTYMDTATFTVTLKSPSGLS